MNNKYNLEITVLSPLHVGEGGEKNWARGVDYVVKDNTAYLLNLEKMIQQGIDVQRITDCYISQDKEGILSLIGNKLDMVVDKKFPIPIGGGDIKTIVRNGLSNKPIIPGSSLKGAIRSIILNHLMPEVNRANRQLNERDYFGSANQGNEFMRFIKIGDAEFERTELVNTKIFNLQRNEDTIIGGWKHARNNTSSKFSPSGFNSIYETLPINEIGVGQIMLSEKAFERVAGQPYNDEKRDLLDIHSLFEIINDHTENYLSKEIAFFEKYPSDKTDKIIESLKNLLESIPEDNSYCVLKMAAGSGFHSITGDWQYDDYSNTGAHNNGKPKYKSRKIAVLPEDTFSLMGFVKLQVITEEEMAARQQAIENKRREEAEAKRKEQEKAEQLQRQIDQYNQLINEAEGALVDSLFDKALQLLNDAQSLYPEGTKHQSLKDTVEELMRKQEEAKKAKEKAEALVEELEQARITGNQVPLSEKLSKATKVPTMIGNLKTWKNLNNKESLSSEEITVLIDNFIRIYNSLKSKEQKSFFSNNSWKNLEKILGNENVVEIISKIKANIQ